MHSVGIFGVGSHESHGIDETVVKTDDIQALKRKKQTMKKRMMVVCALVMGAGAFAAIVPEAEYTTYAREPIMDWLVAPRTTMSLDGAWQIARQKTKAIKFKNAHNQDRTRYEPEPFDPATAKWTAINMPQKIDPYNTIVHLKREIDLTDEQVAKAVVLKSEMAGGSYHLFVNGAEAAYEKHPMGLEVRHDITKWVKSGKNEIYFRFIKGNHTRLWEDDLVGHVNEECLAYPVFLEFRDQVSIEDVFIVTKVEPEKVWSAKVTLTNRTDAAATVDVAAEIEGESAAGCRTPQVSVPANGSRVVELSFPWAEAKLWSPATPELYYAKFELFGRLGEATLPKRTADGTTLPKRTADGTTLPKGTAEGRVGSPSRPVVDAYRQRFGFREVSTKGTRLCLNGKPFMMRRQSFGGNDAPKFETIKRLRQNGYVGMRLFFPNKTARACRLADEYGFLITLCPEVGCGAAWRSDKFWPVYENVLLEMVDRLKNHPAIICWAVSNEFGYTYGGDMAKPNSKYAEPTVRKQQKAAKLVEDADPTRPWTSCGEAELGYPHGGRGTSKIISLHYPYSSTQDWCRYPSVGYWFANGGGGWQGMTRREKPTCISEDLFHGMIDVHTGLSKVGGDLIWTEEGYAQALHDAVRAFTEGHYAAGLAGWEPWCVNLQDAGNRLPLNGRGPLTPDYLIAIRGFYPNLFSGKAETRALYVYNQWFTPVKGKVVQENVVDGKIVSTIEDDVTIDAGGRFEKEITIPSPEVEEPATLLVKFRLEENGKVLAARSFRYNVFPKMELEILKGVALLASTNSPLRRFKFPKGAYLRAADAVKSGATRIVVDLPLIVQDGQALDAFVKKGGFVLMARTYPEAWLPTGVDRNKYTTKLFRRTETAMTDVVDDSLRVWRMDPADTTKHRDTNETLGTIAYRQPQEDSLILFDSGYYKGVTHAQVLWLWRGKGGWLLNSTDAVMKFDCEPAAPSFVQALVDEVADAKPDRLTKEIFFDDPDAPLAAYLKKNNFTGVAKMKSKAKNYLLFIDADGKPLTAKQIDRLKKTCAAGGTVAVFNMAKEENPLVLDLLRIGWKTWESPKVEIPWGQPGRMAERDNGPKFVTRRDNRGAMKGVVNDWLFWWKVEDMWAWARGEVMGSGYKVGMFKKLSMVMNGIIEPRADFKGKLLTDQPAMALAKVGKGVVLFSTLKMNENLDANGLKIAKLVRAILNNLGARTCADASDADWMTVDFRKEMTHTLWENPDYKNEKGWIHPAPIFSGMSDLRYFPVNNCGWSLQAGNKCPVDPFPEDPLFYQGVPFKIQNPDTNDRKAALRVASGDKAPTRIALPPKTRIKKIHFLGAHQWGCQDVKLSFGYVVKGGSPKLEEVATFTGKDHIGDFCWAAPSKLTYGKTAWLGKGGEKARTAALYTWSAENPKPKAEVAFLELVVPKPAKGNSSVGILAITLERADAAGK